jgi:hypothetical protein
MVRGQVCACVCLALLVQPGVSAGAWASTVTAAVSLPLSTTPAALVSAAATTGTPAALTPNADVMAPLPGRPPAIVHTVNDPVEDFFAVTLISMPFTAFWALLGALAIGGTVQKRFPPEFDTPLLISAGSVAAGASVLTGLISVHWGGSRPSPVPSPTPSSTQTPTPDPAPKN